MLNTIDKKMLQLRIIVRDNGKNVMRKLFDDHLTGPINKRIILSCTLCGSEENITQEHVLPKWVFQSDSHHSFKTDVNDLNLKFINATLPLCGRCNSDILNNL